MSIETPQMRAATTNVVRPMPRRVVSHLPAGAHVILPMARRVAFKAGIILPVFRLLVWFWGAVRFLSGNTLDFVLRRDSVQRRAVRLRRVFEDTGGSFAKVGQQLSLRADLLPYAYCVELGKMLDRAPAFPTQQAVAIIERSLKRPLGEVFDVLDPKPIGSASLACVYQARLKTGERVAVKVRRPGIGPLIAADLRAFDWILSVGETLTVLPPGTRRLREDFQTILFNELNFRAEARYTGLFRQRAAKRKTGVTAPRVHFEYCTEEVMVSELVSGVWMWEIMAAVDNDDQSFLARLREQGIDAKSLASKLCFVMQQEIQEELFFHADPHPANLIVLPSNRICFIDFGAIGRFSARTLKAWREMNYHMLTKDVGRMATSSLTLPGSVPPLDVEPIRVAIERIYADWMFAMESKDAQWWERSTAQSWLRYIEVARKFAIPVHLEVIQLLRATVLYDSIVTRLDKDINFAEEYKRYLRSAGREARRRVQRRLRNRCTGPIDTDYLGLEQLADAASQGFFRLQRRLEDPTVRFRNIVGKISYSARLGLRLGYLAAAVLGAALLTDTISRRFFDHEIDWSALRERAMSSGWVQLTAILVGLFVIRRIIIRFKLPDTRLGPSR
jgi:predicted unusual protein kinase regulating ubiquinone biosynthesis (AarF/ABC1/UbiB family)